MTDGLKDKYREAIIGILSANPHVDRAVLFGSRAMETFTPTSDIDIVLFGNKLTLTDHAQLVEAIGQLSMPQQVDLLLYKPIKSSELLAHIKKHGIEWFNRSKNEGNKQSQTKADTGRFWMSSKWKTGTLGDVIELKRGYDLPKVTRIEGLVPVVSSSGTSGTHNEAKVKGPGVVTGRYGTIGKVHLVEEDFWPLNTTLYVRDFKGNDVRFISYFLKQIDFNSCSDKAAVPGVNRNHLHKLPATVPPLDTQKRIAHILGTLDDKIELNRQMNRTLEAMAQAIFKSWFIDFDPVHAKAQGRNTGLPKEIEDLFPNSFQDSELGKIPTGWEAKPLYETAKYINGAAYKNMHFSNGEAALPVVKIAELKKGVTSQTKHTATDLGDKYKIEDGEVLLSWSGNPDTSIGTFVWTGGPAWLNQHIFRVVENRELEKYFVYYYLRHLRSTFAEIARDKQTTGLGHFTVKDMKRMATVSVDDELLKAFNGLVKPLFNNWLDNLHQSNKLIKVFKTLLPNLISGEVAVG